MRTLDQLLTDSIDSLLIVTSWLLLLHIPHPHRTPGRKEKRGEGRKREKRKIGSEGISLQGILLVWAFLNAEPETKTCVQVVG